MAEQTAISWTDHTANFWWGCERVSPLCDHCYAADLDKRYGGDNWGHHNPRKFVGSIWNNVIKWNKKAGQDGVRRRVFAMSMGDMFEMLPKDHPQREELNGVRRQAFQYMEDATNLDWLLLTKRVGNVEQLTPYHWLDRGRGGHYAWPKHIRLGISVGTQKDADRDIPRLLEIDAPNFLSMEPLLEEVRLRSEWINRFRYQSTVSGLFYTNPKSAGDHRKLPRVDWVITGGESGPQARPSLADWFRLLRNQCVEAGVPFHFKQWGEWYPTKRQGHINDPVAQSYAEWWAAMNKWFYTSTPNGYNPTLARVGKKAAGHLLDGKEWLQFPEAT